MCKRKCVIVDLDGTLIDNSYKYYDSVNVHTNHFDIDKFMDDTINDKPCDIIKTIVLDLLEKNYIDVVFLTARHEKYREVTLKWFEKNILSSFFNVDIDHIFDKISTNLYMRSEDERVPDNVSKKKHLENILKKYDVQLAIDDRQENVDLFRTHGIKTLQVWEGI